MKGQPRSAMRWLSALCALLLPVVAAGPAAAQGKPIRIGEINSYSGLATVYTFPYKEGLLMAAKEINDAGGVMGRPIEFVFRDDKLKPDEAVKAARELVGIVGPERGELFVYPGEAHLFTDSSLPSYDADATALAVRRSREFLDRLG